MTQSQLIDESPSSPTIRAADKTSGKGSLLQDVLRISTNSVITTALSFLTGLVLARSLGAEGRGLIAAVLVYPSIFITFGEFGLRRSAAFHLGKQLYSDQRVGSALAALILLTSTIGVVVSAAMLWMTGDASYTPLIIALAVAGLPASIATSYVTGIFLGKRLVGQFAQVRTATELFKLVAIIFFVWMFDLGVTAALVAILLSTVAVGVIAIYRVSKLIPLWPRFDIEVIRSLFAKGVLYGIAIVVMQLNYKVDIVLMDHLTTDIEIGLYSTAVAIAQAIWILPNNMTQAIFSHSATETNEKEFSIKVGRIFRTTTVVAAVCLLTLMLLCPYFVPLVYGSEFVGSVSAIQLLLPGVLGVVAFKPLYNDLAGRGLPNVTLWITIPALIVNVAINFFLIPRYGADGAAIASSFSYLLAAAGMIFLYCQITGTQIRDLLRFSIRDFSFLSRIGPIVRLQRQVLECVRPRR